VLILVTDGQETTSKATLADAIRDARNAHVVVYPVAIQSAVFSPAPLRELARQTGGVYYGVGSTKTLTSVYTTIGNDLRRMWRLVLFTGRRRDALHLMLRPWRWR
jgi:hypothetical protein